MTHAHAAGVRLVASSTNIRNRERRSYIMLQSNFSNILHSHMICTLVHLLQAGSFALGSVQGVTVVLPLLCPIAIGGPEHSFVALGDVLAPRRT